MNRIAPLDPTIAARALQEPDQEEKERKEPIQDDDDDAVSIDPDFVQMDANLNDLLSSSKKIDDGNAFSFTQIESAQELTSPRRTLRINENGGTAIDSEQPIDIETAINTQKNAEILEDEV
eukprot:CAMPEP_0114601076 /NCGR_PEP_ID=MMETSP0125-20121206/23723_1 /TAXON_ID=485358 ORGANISM="Aristerostoma sp., Strain ATCC 50986" /NCGR_SAMPLE_ID=MMETSP0125 /ASSEMBLY_ACC=CAM_ASM_000245 /LENGTH=120 /DNA_ID=CAMNT_0001809999 /DNA_START=1439 /DNA_END=1801 /DNA_ORIENTATION=-